MATPSVWSAVPLVADGMPVSAAVTNAPLRALVDRTAALKAITDQQISGQQTVWRSAPVGASVSVGQVVYLDALTLLHWPAKAVWASTFTSDSRLSPAPSACYTGIVLNKTSANTADLLLYGVGSLSDEAVLNLFGTASPAIGLYYLSSLLHGTVSVAPPSYRSRVLQYFGSNLVRVFQSADALLTHTHKKYTLGVAHWVVLPDPDFAAAPVGAYYAYDVASDPSSAEALLPTVGAPADENIRIDAAGIWWMSDIRPSADIEMLLIAADAQELPLLNTITTDTPEALVVAARNGRVTVTEKEFAARAAAGTAVESWTVVKGLQKHVQNIGYVVSRVKAGLGLSARATQGTDQGEVTLALTLFEQLHISAAVMNLDNAVTAVEGPHVLVLFPAGRLSSVQCRLSLPNFGTAAYRGYLRAMFLSPALGQLAPTGEYIAVPAVTSAGVTPEAPVAISLPALAPVAAVAGNVYLTEMVAPIVLSAFSAGIIQFTLTANMPEQDLRMLDCGLRIELIE